VHLTKKKEKKKLRKNAKIVKMAELNTQSDPPDLFKTKRKKNMQQPVQPDFVLPSGLLTQNRSSKKEINYPSWTFWKLEFFWRLYQSTTVCHFL
jgi:hypothetical protein